MEFALTSISTKVAIADLVGYLPTLNFYNVDVATAYGLAPWACSVYADISKLPTGDTIPATIMDSLDDPQALALHSELGDRPYVQGLPDDLWDGVPHEFAECRIDQTCDQWKTRPDGTRQAYEVCDPVQGHTYKINGHDVACFVLPAYWDASAPGPYCKCGQLTAPFQIAPQGYAVVLDAQGNETQTFGFRRPIYGGPGGMMAAALKLAKRNGRLRKRLGLPR